MQLCMQFLDAISSSSSYPCLWASQWVSFHTFRFHICMLPSLLVSWGLFAVCLEGVWKVSGRCLGVVWVTLDTAWGDMICKQLITIQLDSSILPFSFSPSCLGLVKTAIFWGVCRVSGRCLGGVWRVLCTLRIVSGSYKCQFNCNKPCMYDQLKVFHFLPVAHFGFGRTAGSKSTQIW